jgi:hypothetical protein
MRGGSHLAHIPLRTANRFAPRTQAAEGRREREGGAEVRSAYKPNWQMKSVS